MPGEVAMVQNGNWAWGQISDVDGNTVKESDIKYLPIYTGAEGEENHGYVLVQKTTLQLTKRFLRKSKKNPLNS